MSTFQKVIAIDKWYFQYDRIKRKPHQLILLETRVCCHLKESCGKWIHRKQHLMLTNVLSRRKEASVCFQSYEIGTFLNFAIPVTCEKISSSLSLAGPQSRVKAEFDSFYCVFWAFWELINKLDDFWKPTVIWNLGIKRREAKYRSRIWPGAS